MFFEHLINVQLKPFHLYLFAFTVDKSFAENSYAGFDVFRVMKQKAVFETSASRLARIQNVVNFDIIHTRSAIAFPTAVCLAQRFHNFAISLAVFFTAI
jgi:adenine/guanine phosphoribosyltransferase-like PRPP-binding protein